jgi:multisubunit Na+/H+ antiporter MnhC subunit
MIQVVIEFSLTTVELAICMTWVVIEFSLTIVELGLMYDSGGD